MRKEKDPHYYADGRRRRITARVDDYGRQTTLYPEKKLGKENEHNYKVTDTDIERLYHCHITGEHSSLHDLFLYTKATCKSKQATRKRMYICRWYLKLFDCPAEQSDMHDDEYNELDYIITKQGYELLAERGLLRTNVPTPKGWYKHQKMQSKLYNSFFLNARDRGKRFRFQHEFSKQDHMTIPVKGKSDTVVRPDAMFMLGTDNSFLCFLEADRGSERKEGRGKLKYDTQTIKRKIQNYADVFRLGRHKQICKHDGRVALFFVTTTHTRARMIIDVVADVFPKGCSNIFVTWVDGFGRDFHPPHEIELLDRQWMRHNYPDANFTSI